MARFICWCTHFHRLQTERRVAAAIVYIFCESYISHQLTWSLPPKKLMLKLLLNSWDLAKSYSCTPNTLLCYTFFKFGPLSWTGLGCPGHPEYPEETQQHVFYTDGCFWMFTVIKLRTGRCCFSFLPEWSSCHFQKFIFTLVFIFLQPYFGSVSYLCSSVTSINNMVQHIKLSATDVIQYVFCSCEY